MLIQAKKSEWRSQVANAETERAIQEITAFLEEQKEKGQGNEKFYQYELNQISMIANRWNTMEREAQAGVVEDSKTELRKSKVAQALFGFIDNLPDDLSGDLDAMFEGPGYTGTGDGGTGNGRTNLLAYAIGALLLLAGGSWGINKLMSGDTEKDPIEIPAEIDGEKDTIADIDTTTSPLVNSTGEDLPDEYKIPTKVAIDRYISSEMCPGRFGCLVEEFLPIGWSKNNRYFAYAIQPENLAIGGFDLMAQVIDLKTDKVVWNWKYRERDMRRESEFKDDLKSVWKRFQPAIFQNLSRYDIRESAEKFTMIPFPLTLEGQTYTVTQEQEWKEFYGLYRGIDEETVMLTNQDGATKEIYFKAYDKQVHLHAKAIGAIVSPDRQRIAVLNLQEKPGFEGPPNVLKVQVIGCNLAKGFE